MNDNNTRKSILEMARGAIQERADYEMEKVLDNILDINTPASKERKLTLTLKFTPDAERQTVSVAVEAKSKLVPTNPVTTMLYVSDKDNVVEFAPQIPGQMDLGGEETGEAVFLKVVGGGK